jgi:hypothetical protein
MQTTSAVREPSARVAIKDRIFLNLAGMLAAGFTLALASLAVHLFAALPPRKVFPPSEAQQIGQLREERLATLRRIVELVDQRHRSGSASMAELVLAKRDVAEAELEICTNQMDRVFVLQKMVEDAAVLEVQAVRLAQKNVASEEAALAAKAGLLQLKIRLEDAQAQLSKQLQSCETEGTANQ